MNAGPPTDRPREKPEPSEPPADQGEAEAARFDPRQAEAARYDPRQAAASAGIDLAGTAGQESGTIAGSAAASETAEAASASDTAEAAAASDTAEPASASASAPVVTVTPGPARDVRWSGSVRTAVTRLGEAPVPVTALVDAMLALHGDEYLSGWATVPPAWPDKLLRQSPSRWMRELDELVSAEHVFGRVAIVGWCLLDDRVAAQAERSGMLAGVAQRVTPRLPDFLTPEGLRLFRQRAPMAALTIGELTPPVDLPSRPVTHAALARQPQSAPRAVGRWAVSIDSDYVVGRGSRSRVEHPVLAAPEADRPETSAAYAATGLTMADPPLALAWSRAEVLHALTSGGSLLRFDPRTARWDAATGWAPPTSAAAGEHGVVSSSPGQGSPYWAATDGGGPVPLPQGPGPEDLLALSGTRVAALGSWLLLGGPDLPWVEARVDPPGPDGVLAADAASVTVAGSSGRVQVIRWDGSEPAVGVPPIGPVRLGAGSERLVALAGEDWVALLAGAAVVGRWPVPPAESVTAVALSPDSRALLVATQGTEPSGEPAARVRIWRIDAVPEVRLTEYTADTPEGDDLLGIQPTVDALAAIVSAVAVQPPLSVGLFGAWGSGKSFFMEKLADRVSQLSREAHDSGRPQASLWAWRNIRQIRFNAWHYAAADVWAGMLEHLVKELARPAATGSLDLKLPDELSSLEKRRVEELAGAVDRARESDEALSRAESALAAARQRAAEKSQQLTEATEKAQNARAEAAKKVLDDEVREQLDQALRAAGLDGLGDSLQSTRRDIQEARASLRSAAGLARTGDQRRLSLALAAVLAVGLGVTVLLRALDVDLAAAVGTLTALVGSVGAVMRWVGNSAARVHDRLAKLDEAEQEARRLQAEIDQEIRAARADVVAAEHGLVEAQHRQEQAAQAVEVARARSETTTPGNLLQEYLEGRSTAEDYRGQLGLIGTVHRDLRVISDAVVATNEAAATKPERPLDDVVNRIVLYVDDLDRCPPKVVVKVLEAVSMLMTFPMFVVVVAVDAHWISKSLADVYPRLLTGRDVTPDNYLEKIFQLPVWLERPGDEAAAAMARTLLTGTSGPPPGSEVDAARGTPTGGSGATGSPVVDTGAGQQGSPRAAPTVTGDVSLATTPPAAITLEDSEVVAIEALAPLIARSPRALKRYLNTYRVLKALIDPDDLEPARLLLGVATGRPDVGERLLADVLAAAPGQSLNDVVAAWEREDREWLRESLPAELRTWSALDCTRLKPVATQVRRFVFHAQSPPDRPAEEPEAPDGATAQPPLPGGPDAV